MANALIDREERLTRLLDRYNFDTVVACIEELKRQAEQHIRSYVEEIPEGICSYIDTSTATGQRTRH